MNRQQRRAQKAQGEQDLRKIEYVVLDGEQVPIWSVKLDEFCNDEGDLVLQGSGDEALVISGWRDHIRQEVN